VRLWLCARLFQFLVPLQELWAAVFVAVQAVRLALLSFALLFERATQR
jgi:hypothetical protein